MITDTIIDDERWHALDLPSVAETGAQAALVHLGLRPEDYEIAVLGCDDARIADLNAEFRDKPVPTNVLSWPAENLAAAEDGDAPLPPPEADVFGSAELGDIAIAYETCLREAEAGQIGLPDHVTHLIVHGTLHLLGYDHVRDGDAALMERLETDILCKLGIADPCAEKAGAARP
ncbi:rRNA maturation factor [Roseivivax halodurans JCM 10272]|uniref:Endoribonuclease YbeY n=1 Tax=Roseivivax halodurans JCM 10272 TaxID=1449350 RepID=X7EHW3_9RHOB|nr:rRNA maturation RNase YbeY [Roseivivax halodurans]ETX14776.1 rRNA maturation factor [Roseivivax halodurans JCM 10272]